MSVSSTAQMEGRVREHGRHERKREGGREGGWERISVQQ